MQWLPKCDIIQWLFEAGRAITEQKDPWKPPWMQISTGPVLERGLDRTQKIQRYKRYRDTSSHCLSFRYFTGRPSGNCKNHLLHFSLPSTWQGLSPPKPPPSPQWQWIETLLEDVSWLSDNLFCFYKEDEVYRKHQQPKLFLGLFDIKWC